MNQTIEQIRLQAARGHETGEVMAAFPQISAARSFIIGAEWEYNRTKWVRDRLPEKKGYYLVRINPVEDVEELGVEIHIEEFNPERTSWVWAEFFEWAEIPL